jgi:hypothetical protein
LIAISFQLEVFLRLNAVFTAFHTRNTTHATFSFETSPAARKTPPYVDNERIFFPVLDISTFKRCFYCISHEEYNARHLNFEQAQRLVKRRLTSIMNVFSFQMEIFRRINAAFVAFHTPNTTRATFSFEASPTAGKTPPYIDIERIFFPVGDISTFKRCFCCISHEEYNARHF